MGRCGPLHRLGQGAPALRDHLGLLVPARHRGRGHARPRQHRRRLLRARRGRAARRPRAAPQPRASRRPTPPGYGRAGTRPLTPPRPPSAMAVQAPTPRSTHRDWSSRGRSRPPEWLSPGLPDAHLGSRPAPLTGSAPAMPTCSTSSGAGVMTCSRDVSVSAAFTLSQPVTASTTRGPEGSPLPG